jgi:hypothetical protein
MAEEKPVAGERLPDEAKLRRYLLGKCSREEAGEIELSMFGEEAQPILEVVEDELIEDYITGELDESDRPHFEQRLLRSEALAEKIKLCATLLGRQEVAEELGGTIAALKKWTSIAGGDAPPPKELENHLYREFSFGALGATMAPKQTSMAGHDAPPPSELVGLIPLGYGVPPPRPPLVSAPPSFRTKIRRLVAAGILALRSIFGG